MHLSIISSPHHTSQIRPPLPRPRPQPPPRATRTRSISPISSIRIPHQRLQQRPHIRTPLTIRRIIINRKHAHGAETPTAHNGTLARETAVPIDTSIRSRRDGGAVAEEPRGRIQHCEIDVRAAGHAGLDKGRGNASGGCQGGDGGVVDAEAVAEG